MITVTKTFLPPQVEYNAILKRAWDRNWITNRGELVLELESKLRSYLGVENVIAMTNGTLPIQIAIKALGLKGEIITTPFSYVATTSSIVWEGCTPVFVDIDPEYLTIDETKIEAAITSDTTGILATHVFGNPCNIEVIAQIAKKHNLKVIYDAAHCFGVMYKGQSIFNYGDISTCSFHATKLFHTGEGGAAFCNKNTYDPVYFGHNFGHDGPDKFNGLGINAKMSELQAAMGLCNFKYIDSLMDKRKEQYSIYQDLLAGKVKTLKLRSETIPNSSYFPIILTSESQCLHLINDMNKYNIYPRRYFYPSLNKMDYVEKYSCPVSENTANSILCLPLYDSLSIEDQKLIIDIVKKVACEQ
jgi:dTDP-4-amino-4,6-dideoxygalactose transaminase